MPSRLKRNKVLSRADIFALDPHELTSLIRLQGWHKISIPPWEGEKWCQLIQKLEAQDITKDHVAEEYARKQQRQQSAKSLQEKRDAKSARTAPAAPTAPRTSREAHTWKPERGCTCGCPNHQEKCRLYRQRPVYTSYASAKSTFDQKPKAKSASPAADSIAPSKQLTPWARGQVTHIFREVRARPRAEWRNLLKQSMLRFHPDKKRAPDHPFASRKDVEVAEVFMDIKRLYDSVSAPKVR